MTPSSGNQTLFKLTRHRYEQLREVKLGCAGETTTTLRFGGLCTYEQGSQLADAVAFLHENAGQIAFVTIDVGANDVLSGGGPAAVAQNLPQILAALRAAAGPGVPIVGMNSTTRSSLLSGSRRRAWQHSRHGSRLPSASTTSWRGSTARSASRSRTSRALSRSPT